MTCTSNATIASGVTGIVVATISVTPTTQGPLSNTATVGGGGDNSPNNNTSPPVNTSVGAIPLPDLMPQMTGPTTAVVGTAFDYVITLSNIGTAPTTGPYSVVDVIPAGLTIGPVNAGPTFNCSVVLQTVTCTSSTPIGPGTTGVPVATITVTPNTVGGVSNTATAGGGGDNSPANNTTPPVNTAVGTTAKPDLEMGKSGPGIAAVRVAFDYTLSVSNVGSGPTAGTITVTDVIDPSLGIGNVAAGPNFSCATNAQTVTCTSNVAIAAGTLDVLVATITVVPNEGGTTVSNIASVDGGNDDTPGNNVSPPVNTSIGPLAKPDLDIMKFGPRTAAIGVQWSYTITISNIGTAATTRPDHRHRPRARCIDDQQCRRRKRFLVQRERPDGDLHVERSRHGRLVRHSGRRGHGDGDSRRLDRKHGDRRWRRGRHADEQREPAGGHRLRHDARPAADIRPIPALSPTMLVVLALLVALFAILGLVGGAPRKRDLKDAELTTAGEVPAVVTFGARTRGAEQRRPKIPAARLAELKNGRRKFPCGSARTASPIPAHPCLIANRKQCGEGGEHESIPSFDPTAAIAASLALSLVIAPAMAVSDAAVRQAGNIAYASGGISEEGRENLNAIARDFNLKLILATKSGAYLSDVGVVVSDDRGTANLRQRSPRVRGSMRSCRAAAIRSRRRRMEPS